MKKYVGFIAPKIETDHHILGDSSPIFPQISDGNWLSYLPEEENQDKGFETFNCTSFNTLNAIETLLYKTTGQRFNFSDRWLGIVAGTKEPGNDPHVVCEAIRKNGLIPEEMLPFSDQITTIDEYYSFKGANEAACRKAGQDWLAKYDFKHKWAFQPGQPEKINNMKVALKSSPLAMAVYAWASDGRGVYVAMGPQNHWTSLYAIGQYENVFDSYDPFKKLVDQDIIFCKVFSITVRPQDEQKKIGLLQSLLEACLKLLGLYKEQAKLIPVDHYQEVKAAIQPPKYLWDTKENIRHSLRVICDEEGLNLEQKNTMCATVQAESGFNLNARNENKVNGKVVSVDLGICQWNDYYHRTEITPEESVSNPEKAVRLMCSYWKRGQRNVWIAYKSSAYRKFL